MLNLKKRDLLIIGGTALGVYLIGRAAAVGAKKALDTVNPANRDNVINKGFTAATNALTPLPQDVLTNKLTGEPLSLGDKLFILLNPVKAQEIGLTEGNALDTVNPASRDNVINKGFTAATNALTPLPEEKLTNKLTGEPLSLGDKLFIFFNPNKAKDIGLT